MSKKIYDLSIANQAQDERRVIKSTSGKEYDVSFVPAIVNRKYYKRWSDVQAELLKILPDFFKARQNLENGVVGDTSVVERVKALSAEGAEAGTDMLVFVMRANGYTEFDEDELFTEFSEEDISRAINFIVKLEDGNEEVKKKRVHKARS